MTKMLIAIDPRMYRQVLAHVVRQRRPSVEVLTAEPEELEEVADRLAPHLIICHQATPAVRASAWSWVELEVRLGAGDLEANVKVDGSPASRVECADVSDILAALDETENMLQQA